METEEMQIRCKKCEEEFDPRLNQKKGWTCPNCETRNPDLRLHYRVVMGIALLGFLLIGGLTVARLISGTAPANSQVVPLLETLVLLVTVLVLALKKEPWANGLARGLVWVVFGSVFALEVVLPIALQLMSLCLGGEANSRFIGFVVPFGLVYCVLLGYLLWLHMAAKRAA